MISFSFVELSESEKFLGKKAIIASIIIAQIISKFDNLTPL